MGNRPESPGRANYYSHRNPNGICDMCGHKFKKSELRETWDHKWVCEYDHELRQPQDKVRAGQGSQSIENARPEQGSVITYWDDEMSPDVNVDDPTAWDFSWQTQSPAWAFDSSSLLWGPQKQDDWLAIQANRLATTTGVEYAIEIDITDYDQNGTTKPQLRVWLGWDNTPILFNLANKPSSFTLTGTQIADNTTRGPTDPSVWINFDTAYPPVFQGQVINDVTFRIQRFSIKTSDSQSAMKSGINTADPDVFLEENEVEAGDL